jgi:hypothetical protein
MAPWPVGPILLASRWKREHEPSLEQVFLTY